MWTVIELLHDDCATIVEPFTLVTVNVLH
jgi:hypothetical protein